MKKIFSILLLISIVISNAPAQTESALKVKFMTTYDVNKKLFTTWLVPAYSTPNINNPDTQEKGVTAQIALKVPKGFIIKSLNDEKGNWEKNPIRIGSQVGFIKAGVDVDYEYYVIGKMGSETNYGVFKSGEPVALFSFKGDGGDPAKVSILENNDPFIKIADKSFSLNVQNSFYSRSGQVATHTASPLEQGAGSTTLKEVIATIAKKVSSNTENNQEYPLLAYPNPSSDIMNLKYFVETDNAEVNIELVDMAGIMHPLTKSKATLGINSTQIRLKDVINGAYILKMTIDDKIYTQRIIREN